MFAMTNMNFQCKRCGKCCKHRGDVLLTPMDIFHIAKLKDVTCKEVVEKFTQLRTSQGDKYPRLVVRARDPQMTCVFYDKRIGCTIYPVRPIACSLFPLMPVTEDKFSIQYCNGVNQRDGEKVNIIDWIQENSTRYESEKGIRKFFIEASADLENRHPITSKEQVEKVKELVYCNYDVSKDMEAQIRKNMEM